jgi:hypothetical protein
LKNIVAYPGEKFTLEKKRKKKDLNGLNQIVDEFIHKIATFHHHQHEKVTRSFPKYLFNLSLFKQ